MPLPEEKKRQERFLKRASEELSHYNRFSEMIRQNQKAWNNFWNTSKKNVQKVLALLHKAHEHLKALKSHLKKAALIELPESYGNALAEISSDFEGTYDNLDGLRPVISNLLEIIRKPHHLNKHEIRQHIRSLLRHIIERLGDKVNEYEEENEHQIGLYEGLDKLFNDAREGGAKVVKALEGALKRTGKKIAYLKIGIKGSEQLVKASFHVGFLRSKECRRHHRSQKRKNIRAEKVLGIVSQLHEVISDRWSTLHGKFLQMMDQESSN